MNRTGRDRKRGGEPRSKRQRWGRWQGPVGRSRLTRFEHLEDRRLLAIGLAGTLDQQEPAARDIPLEPFASPVVDPPIETLPGGLLASAAPASYDLRTFGQVTPVKDQGSCSSCWSFATYASLESNILVDGGPSRDFAERALAYHDFDWGPCSGGNIYISSAELTAARDPFYESQYPYGAPGADPGVEGTPGTVHYYVREMPIFDTATEIKNAVISRGGLYTSYYVDNAYYDATDEYYYYFGGADSNHGVTIVGWDDSVSRTLFNGAAGNPPGDGAWLIKNSWGASSHTDGYFWLSYYDKFMRPDELYGASFSDAVPQPDTFQTIYTHDEFGYVSNFNAPYGFNAFAASADEQLSAVNIWTLADGASYDVRVYDAFSGGSLSGLLAQQTGTVLNWGNHTIDLSTPVSLTAGDDFYIYLHVTGGGNYPMAFDKASAGYSSNSTAAAGQSFYSFNGTSWTDLTTFNTTANFSIKGLTLAEQPEMDFGDAPTFGAAAGYATRLADDGARHGIGGPWFGDANDAPDLEPDGQPDPAALGDDGDVDPANPGPNHDDENGVQIPVLTIGQPDSITLEINGGGGTVFGWIDFNGNQIWEPSEQVAAFSGGNGMYNVPVTAPAGSVTGQTFARFRIASNIVNLLEPTGPAPNGEVEDHEVIIDSPPVSVPKWEQPPQRTQPENVLLGWNEFSVHESQQIAADDWVCQGDQPVTDVTWWGSFIGWDYAGQPPLMPDFFHVAFWEDVPGVPGTPESWSRPGSVLYEADIFDFQMDWVGWDYDPRPAAIPEGKQEAPGQYESAFRFEAALPQWFYQEPGGGENIYWVSIAAGYLVAPWEVEHPFGWKVRPRDANSAAPDDAVRIWDPTGAHPGQPFTEGQPIWWPTERESWDLAFELGTLGGGGEQVKWEQRPDLDNGLDVLDGPGTNPISGGEYEKYLADDFRCNATGPITRIEVWGSYWEDIRIGELPLFNLAIFSDIPAEQSPTGYSMPGEVLWSAYLEADMEEQYADAFEEFFDPNPNEIIGADNMAWQYTFDVDPTEAFVQQEGEIYWLGVHHSFDFNGDGVVGPEDLQMAMASGGWSYGWKTSMEHFNDDAVFTDVFTFGGDPKVVPDAAADWRELIDPRSGESIDLAFRLTTSSQSQPEPKWSQPPLAYVPDDAYHGWDEYSVYGHDPGAQRPQIVADDWLCTTDQPVTDVHWWGSFIGWYEPQLPWWETPQRFHLGIWKDVPADPGDPASWSHPSEMIWEAWAEMETGEVGIEFVGWDFDPRDPTAPPEATFLFEYDLPEGEWFWQEPGENVYWLSISADYAGMQVEHPFGWKTRPRDPRSPAPDDAVRIFEPVDPVPGMPFSEGQPIFWPNREDSWDMAFVLTTREECSAAIEGYKWLDDDGDGVWDGTEPGLPGWHVYIDLNENGLYDAGEPDAWTGAGGYYIIEDLCPGTYVVAEEPQNGWQQTFPGPGGGVNLLGAKVAVTTTGSTAPVYSAGEPLSGGDVSIKTNLSGPLINMDLFRADPRFAGTDGSGFTTVILDTGIDVDHPYFGPDSDSDGVADRIVYQWDYVNSDPDASDDNGHGANVSSIAASEDGTYTGMAPGADIVHLKVLNALGKGSFSSIESALQWVVSNAAAYNVASVNMSLGDGYNYGYSHTRYGIGDELAALEAMDVIVSSASGNDFFPYGSTQGVAYPAADPNSLSIGAVWDGVAPSVPVTWSSGAVDNTTAADRIVSFSQRHATLSDVFAPGAWITGAGATGSTSRYGGTSQASPHIAGIAALAQQIAGTHLGRRLTLGEFGSLLRSTAVTVNDGDDEDDNVVSTGLNFPRVDMLALAEGILAMGPGTHIVVLGPGQIASDVNFGNLPRFDFGDAPDSPFAVGYPTLLGSNGARHLIGGPWLGDAGDTPDGEPNGQPDPNALGDDTLDGNDDEDGVSISPVVPGMPATFQVQVNGGGGFLQVWVDYNRDRTWQPAEQIYNGWLFDGNHNISDTVPINAVPGQTFARFRISTFGGLGPGGPARDGEVEDHEVFIEEPPSWPKWIQTPQPARPENVLLGWNEYSVHDQRIAADDWVCRTDEPVTDVTWWGSFIGWEYAQEPPLMPDYFHVAFWTDVPGDPAEPDSWSRPGRVVYEADVDYQAEWVGWDYDPREQAVPAKGPAGDYESAFRFDAALPQWFYQDPTGEEGIYWVSIAAVYPLAGVEYPFGWKTRPRHPDSAAPDDAVRIFEPVGAHLGDEFAAGQPIFWPTERHSWDLAFELHTQTDGGTEEVKWEQTPDLDNGLDVLNSAGLNGISPNATLEKYLADDFRCNASGPITRIELWSSYWNDYRVGELPWFNLAIFSDIPADQSPTGYSMPGDVLWSAYLHADAEQQFADASEEFFDPNINEIIGSDTMVWQYTFDIDPALAFQQVEGEIYWLGAHHSFDLNGDGRVDDLDFQMTMPLGWSYGWKTSGDHFNDDAVFTDVFTWGSEPQVVPDAGADWKELIDPRTGQSLDLSFRLTTTTGPEPKTKWSQPPQAYVPHDAYYGWDEESVYGHDPGALPGQIVADDWFCNTDQPVTDVHWWGSFLDWYRPDAPGQMPDRFHFGIWTDVPAGSTDPPLPWSHPGKMIWEARADVAAGEVGIEFVGWDFDPRDPMAPPEATFYFDYDLPEADWFWQEPGENVYWISISAEYANRPIDYPFGWKTRPRDPDSWAPDDAVRIFEPTEPAPGAVFHEGQPIYWPTPEQSWDMAFALTTREVDVDLDFGDAPDSLLAPRYPTLRAHDGARHVLGSNVYLGAGVDADPDGQPVPPGMGDDLDAAVDDEDGVGFLTGLTPGKQATLTFTVTAPAPGAYLEAWIDFGRDDSWAQPGDRLLSFPIMFTPGSHNINFTVPNTAVLGTTYARFRLSTTAGLSYDGLARDGEVEDYEVTINSSIEDRHIFYNNSAFDGNNPLPNPADDLAIAPPPPRTDPSSGPLELGKTALLPGTTASFKNYTSYSRGINGIMVDIASLPGLPTAADFVFRVGNDNNPAAWPPAPPPGSITVRPGAGTGGSDRVTIIWPDYNEDEDGHPIAGIGKQWLLVCVLATPNTGLAAPDNFYWGNAIGESGNSSTDAKVDANDMLAARNNTHDFLNPAPIDDFVDFDRDGRVNATDMLIARNNPTHFLNALRLITVPAVGPCVKSTPEGDRPAAQLAAEPLVDAVLQAAGRRPTTVPAGSPARLQWLYEYDHLATAADDADEDGNAVAIGADATSLPPATGR